MRIFDSLNSKSDQLWFGKKFAATARKRFMDWACNCLKKQSEGDEVALAVRDRCLNVWVVDTVALIHAYDPELSSSEGA